MKGSVVVLGPRARQRLRRLREREGRISALVSPGKPGAHLAPRSLGGGCLGSRVCRSPGVGLALWLRRRPRVRPRQLCLLFCAGSWLPGRRRRR